MGDNITPPQQAFNWIADVYGSTEEIKANGQTIVGLLHEDIGHLGIFVSGSVAKKEHAQIVEVLKYIQELPPGLYGMQIDELPQPDGDDQVRRHAARAQGRGPAAPAEIRSRRREAVRGGRGAVRAHRARVLAARAAVRARADARVARARRCATSIRCACSTGRSRTRIRGCGRCRISRRRAKSRGARARTARWRRAAEHFASDCAVRGARPVSRPARRRCRGRVLPGVRQHAVAADGRRARGDEAQGASSIRARCPPCARCSTRSTRAARREGLARIAMLIRKAGGGKHRLSQMQRDARDHRARRRTRASCPRTSAAACCRKRRSSSSSSRSARSARCRGCCARRPIAARAHACSTASEAQFPARGARSASSSPSCARCCRRCAPRRERRARAVRHAGRREGAQARRRDAHRRSSLIGRLAELPCGSRDVSDAVLIVNAGSSSVKFSVYDAAQGAALMRGQVQGARRRDRALRPARRQRRCGGGAAVRTGCRSRRRDRPRARRPRGARGRHRAGRRGASRGARRPGPRSAGARRRARARRADGTHPARPVAPAPQHRGHRGRDPPCAVVAAGRVLRHRVPPHAAAVRAAVRAAAGVRRARCAPLWVPRPVVRIRRRRAAGARPARGSAAARSSRTSATVRRCARCTAGAASRPRWASPRSTAW